MREIKFRCWYHGGGDPRVTPWMEFSYPFTVIFWKNIDMWELACELMQYTGIKDVNGVEIFEGDIVEIYDTKAMIEFKCGAFFIVQNKNETNSWPLSAHYENLTVIGNIYENPELLEGINNDSKS